MGYARTLGLLWRLAVDDGGAPEPIILNGVPELRHVNSWSPDRTRFAFVDYRSSPAESEEIPS